MDGTIYCYFYISYIEFHPCYFGGENSIVSYHIVYHSITQVSYYVNGLNDHFHVRCDPWVFYRNIILCHNVPAMHLVNSLSRVTHTCVSKLGHHCFRWWLVACSTPSHHLNQCWIIGSLGTNLSEILFEIHAFSFKKMHLERSSGNSGHFVSASMCWHIEFQKMAVILQTTFPSIFLYEICFIVIQVSLLLLPYDQVYNNPTFVQTRALHWKVYKPLP